MNSASPNYRTINDQVAVSMIGVGGGPLGNLYREISDEDAQGVLESAWAEGFRYFDTAPFYGLGLSEQRVGCFLRKMRRTDFTLSTKVGRLLSPAAPASERYGFINPFPNDIIYDYGYDGVMRSLEASLERLGLDSIDIVLMHDLGEMTHGDDAKRYFKQAMGGGYRRLDELRSSGVIKAIGIGANEADVCVAAMDHGRWDCFMLAGRYTLLEQDPLDDFLPKCVNHGASVLLAGVYNSGILGTGTRGDVIGHYNYHSAPQHIVDRVRQLESICDAFNVPLPAAAIQFSLSHPAIASVVLGMGKVKRIQQTTKLATHKIPGEFWNTLKSKELIRADAPTPLCVAAVKMSGN